MNHLSQNKSNVGQPDLEVEDTAQERRYTKLRGYSDWPESWTPNFKHFVVQISIIWLSIPVTSTMLKVIFISVLKIQLFL